MAWYIARRTAWAVVLLLFISLFTFILLHLIPGNPAIILAGIGAKPEEIHALYIELGPEQAVTVAVLQILESACCTSAWGRLTSRTIR